ncbi:Xaa-Pro aminopeptidase [Paraneptunicella aestuarii]|uniref:Xaa-Pro aminopeptidase n=1 Tax=Paraneptunicella aestuarii TaxID=2831148 RepID=UPI001E507D47|nr:Xaa-Pro aminopeptidase [Paraneptunicella aestuarii]UAA39852.1 Xaa-Pro aminopeptidase [Paraneptunicella aestuarii]
MIPQSEYLQRRQRLMAQLPQGSAVLVASGVNQSRGNDTEFPFSQDSDFYYLTGFNEPNAWLYMSNFALNADGSDPSSSQNHHSVLFCQPKDKAMEIWHGLRLGVEQACDALLVDEAMEIDDLEEALPELLNNHAQVYFLLGSNGDDEALIFSALQVLRSAPKQSKSAPSCIVDLAPVLHEMRLIKSAAEIQVMQKAADISCEAHKRAMLYAKPGVYEYQLEGEILHEFVMSGARTPAYNTIVGSGVNACILHYTNNHSALKDGDLVLIDAGANYQGYAADITRTFPANGKFTEEQATLYNLVLQSQLQAMEILVPGGTFKQATDKAVEIICTGLIELGILSGSLEDNVKNMTWRAFFMHGLGHWLGLNVHDVGMYKINGEDRPLQPGMVLTVEPGIYIDHDADVEDKWKGIGIRIEDNILITEQGNVVLTAAVPKTIADIEALMAQR